MSAHARKDPLQGNRKYEKIKDLNAGAFGFVQLARDKETGEKVAIKFMERGAQDHQGEGTAPSGLQSDDPLASCEWPCRSYP